MRDLTLDLNRVEQLGAVGEAETVLHMDEEAFRAFYDRTARQVWAYLSRLSGSPQTADDLLQEAYYRFLRADRVFDSDDHRRNYLFRIATNLVHDGFRRQRITFVEAPDENAANALRTSGDEGDRAAERADLSRALARLKPRERSLLLLAYAQGSSHVEIAETLGVKTSSVKALLFRARRRLAGLMKGEGRP
jgi:RNA polymerase sigma-70 factor (ECF subfamily)